MTTKKEELIKASQSIAVKAYQKVQQEQQAQQGTADAGTDDNVVDADYEDIK